MSAAIALPLENNFVTQLRQGAVMKRPRILFICKQNWLYGEHQLKRRSAGLYNSTNFIVQSLNWAKIDAKIIEVIDNNCIDREVRNYDPDIVVI